MKQTTIILNENGQAFIAEQINAGKFENESEVISAALQLLQESAKKDELLLNALQEGEASGFDENFDPKAFKELLHKTIAQS